ncbi:MAG: pantoate--beta-alanine ligase [Firmicutes bacterium]|nr:pantoate--beta-alanine ligase [Bacillota bacterium]
MIIVKTIEQTREVVRGWKAEGKTVGLCPTMGYLHEGHLSLMTASKKDNDKTVATVFVNPMQFGPTEDLAKYPRDLERDCRMMEAEGVDMVFAPEAEEMYADDFCTFVDMTGVSEGLCGRSRPVMFRGVCTVLTKLINIVCPDRMYLGKKDAQQLAVVRRMVRDLDFDLEVVGCPTVREEDGLAKSSRNTYMNPEQRQASRVLSRSLRAAQDAIAGGQTDSGQLTRLITKKLKEEPMSDIDYVEIVDGLSMQPVEKVRDGDLVAIAVRIGTTRLIDNFIVGDPLIETQQS